MKKIMRMGVKKGGLPLPLLMVISPALSAFTVAVTESAAFSVIVAVIIAVIVPIPLTVAVPVLIIVPAAVSSIGAG